MKRNIFMIFLIVSVIAYFPFGSRRAFSQISEEQNTRKISLIQGIHMVLKNNRDIKVSLPEDEMAYQDSLAARSALLPHLNLTAKKTYRRYQPKFKADPAPYAVSEQNPFSYGVDVYQTLFDFGKDLSRYRASKFLWKATKAHTESVRRIAVLEFVVSYFNLLETQSLTTVANQEVESLNAYLRDLQELFDQGVIVKNDLLSAKVRLADAKQKLIAARNENELAQARLNNILGRPLNESISITDTSKPEAAIPEIEQAWKIAENLRPEMLFYADQIKAALAAARAKRAGNLPEVFLNGGYSYEQNQYEVKEDNLAVNLGVKMNFFDGGQSKAEAKKERLRAQQLQEKKNKIIEDIKFEIEDCYFGLKNARDKVVVAQDALAQAQENVRFHREKYKHGSATSTDVLEAITLQTQAQTNYFNADYAVKREYAKLLYSTGENFISVYEKMEKETE